MIKNIANLLSQIINEEKKKLNEYNMKHGPTIGKMYEGLTSELLKKSIPNNLSLKVVTGIIYNDNNMTGEIDCMIVAGNGEKIPYTNSYKWHIKDVIAVIEVKKTLYKDNLIDSFEHLRKVQDSYMHYIESSNNNETIDISSSLRAFSEVTGIFAPSFNDSAIRLSATEEVLYHTFISEQHSPIRIVIGYNGYKSEQALRDSFIDYLDQNLNTNGYGVTSFPQLIICDKYSLIKMNGQPYNVSSNDGYWNFYVSSQANSALILLEILWTKLARKYNLSESWGNDLEMETFNQFLGGKILEKNNSYGWEYNYTDLNNKHLQKQPSTIDWKPTYVTKNEFMIFNRLCSGIDVYVDDIELLDYLKKEGEDVPSFFNLLIDTGLIALDDKTLRLTTEQCQCAILSDGSFVVAENNSGRFSKWIEKL
ncbi:MAG: Unknown protein [uncultured Sulfurovum sp.]|uniref:DUF6602 domain-containing protein n=1 Tax=uncultured Sulfurovum sp. TaxID=269237 RepID=A0A6S6U2U8_9BACT|nr:MAG: Unknown protein [uncultured Sulfurovum sp.]